MPQFRQPFSSWSKRRSDWMSAKISSSLARGSGAASPTGSPMCFWTRVPSAAWDISVGHHLAVFFHHLFDEVRPADHSLALGDEVFLLHVEEVEVRRAAVELDARLVRFLDEVVDRLGRAFLHPELLRDALLHQAPGGGGADDFHLVVHRRGDGGLED